MENMENNNSENIPLENPSSEINKITENEKQTTKQNKNKKHKKKKKKSFWKWPVTVLFLTLFLSTAFSLGSEFLLSGSGLIISIILLLVFIIIAVICDMLGVAVTAAETEPFVAMSSRKVKVGKQALKLVQNAEKLSSVFCDVIGDICGILSGTVGATIVAAIAITGEIQNILIASVVSALIAGLTVFLKALGKTVAIKNANSLVLNLAKIISFFKPNK